jgi:hypothetical protein
MHSYLKSTADLIKVLVLVGRVALVGCGGIVAGPLSDYSSASAAMPVVANADQAQSLWKKRRQPVPQDWRSPRPSSVAA